MSYGNEKNIWYTSATQQLTKTIKWGGRDIPISNNYQSIAVGRNRPRALAVITDELLAQR